MRTLETSAGWGSLAAPQAFTSLWPAAWKMYKDFFISL